MTWLADANYAKTSGYDADGLMDWQSAMDWAANLSYYDSVRGLTVRQQFYVYPNDMIVCLNSVDGGYTVNTLQDDNEVIFRSRNPMYFQ